MTTQVLADLEPANIEILAVLTLGEAQPDENALPTHLHHNNLTELTRPV